MTEAHKQTKKEKTVQALFPHKYIANRLTLTEDQNSLNEMNKTKEKVRTK